jgi:hypothetical protein
MEYRKDWERSKERHIAFWQGEIVDRCLFSVVAPKSGRTWIDEVPPDSPEDWIRWVSVKQ